MTSIIAAHLASIIVDVTGSSPALIVSVSLDDPVWLLMIGLSVLESIIGFILTEGWVIGFFISGRVPLFLFEELTGGFVEELLSFPKSSFSNLVFFLKAQISHVQL